MAEEKPKGSGYFSLAVGVLFLLILIASFGIDLRMISPLWFLRSWLAFAAVILVVWGGRRIKEGRSDWTVGQSTLNFVVGVVGATVAIFALIAQQPAAPTAPPSASSQELLMTVDDFQKIATPLAWPFIALLAILLFYEPAHALLQRLSETLTFKSIKVKPFGVEVELTAEYARSVLHELLDDITESTNKLTPEEIKLFDSILQADGAKTVDELIAGFAREDSNHERLRRLRDQKLIIPRERGNWKAEKHPIVTRYGQLVAKLRYGSAAKVQEFKSKGDG